MALSEQEAYEELRSKLSDKNWRLNHLYYIKDKHGKKVIFKHNPVQATYRKNKHNRNIILKARQQGFTTETCIDKLDNCLFNSYYDAGIIADNLPNAEKIFTNKIKFAYDELPEWLRRLRPADTDRAGELRFNNGSSISVSTSYRGGTLRSLHVSEYGKICAKFPEKAREIKSGAFNAVPLDGEITVESTAEGMNGDFYDMCDKAQALNNDSLTELDFKMHFFAWFESKEYRINPSGIEITHDFKVYFDLLKSNHGIDLDDWQKAWYVKKSEEQNEDMKQEYPSYPEEAFRASGRPVFNLEKIARDIKRTKDLKPFRGIVSVSGFESITNGPIIIFKKPIQGESYSIGADVSEGLAEGDDSTACVLNKNLDVVAVYCGKIAPDQFGGLLVNLAMYYNGAVLAPEINNHGISVIDSIKRKNYFNLYRREVKEELGEDKNNKVGWHTNIKTKMLMLDELKAAFREDVIQINCADTLREMMSLTIKDDGNVELNSKDRTVALAIAIQAIKQASGSTGTHDSASKTSFKTLNEMLKYGEMNRDQESYFD